MIHKAISFVTVVKAGSFSAAANQLGISKAQVSRHVSQLEAELGMQLLFRTTRSITLTESGEAFFLNCRNIEESYAEAVDQLKQNFQALKGTLRITAPISYGSEFLPPVIYAFNQQYPNIKIILSLSSTLEDLIEKNFDLSIRIAPSLPDSNLRMRKLKELDFILCAAPNYLQKNPTIKSIEDLSKHSCITSINRSLELSKITWSFYEGNKIIKATPNCILEVDGVPAQKNLVLLGMGVALFPKIFVEKELEQGSLVQVLQNLKMPSYYVYLLYPNRKVLPKKLQVFIQFLSEWMG